VALTEQKRRYAAARLSGKGKKESAIEAGCPEKTASQAASRYEKDPDVLAAMGRIEKVEAEKNRAAPGSDEDTYIPAQVDDPVEFFKSMTNDLMADPKLRLDAAKAWASFTLAKPGEKGKKEEKQEKAEAAGKKFQSAPPPLKRVK
jgi:phage terminase small subunit